MSEREEFLSWFETTWRAAEVALHNGDAGPRFATWSDRQPVTLFGAWFQTSMAPLRSPTGLEMVIVPIEYRDLIFASAARPPTAFRYFSTSSSAV